MRRVLVLVSLVACLLCLPGAPAGATTYPTLDGVRVAVPAGGAQVVTVNHTSGYHARVIFWQRTGGRWKAVTKTVTDGRIGYGGLVVGTKRRQSTGTTPLGTYRLLSSFGSHARAATWNLTYRRIASGSYWVEDNQSAYYNRYRTKAQGGFRWWLKSGPDTSERLADYPTQYEYAIVTGFNHAQVRHRGAGIFLHVNGKGATAGCVSAPRWFLRSALARLNPAQKPVIAIGR